MRPLRTRPLIGAAFAACVALGCGEDGQDLRRGQCPRLPLYDVRKVQGPEDQPAQVRQASRGSPRCITPIGTAVTDPQAPGSTGGSGGGGGAGGGGGQPADAGSDAAP